MLAAFAGSCEIKIWTGVNGGSPGRNLMIKELQSIDIT